jgi:hypothetical protein
MNVKEAFLFFQNNSSIHLSYSSNGHRNPQLTAHVLIHGFVHSHQAPELNIEQISSISLRMCY